MEFCFCLPSCNIQLFLVMSRARKSLAEHTKMTLTTIICATRLLTGTTDTINEYALFASIYYAKRITEQAAKDIEKAERLLVAGCEKCTPLGI